jgi:two-component system, sensor histidine kinase and response regulator
MLDTVIRNLTNNALKFTPQGGAVTLSARPGQDKFIEIAVKDTGVEMSKQDIDKLFKLGGSHSTLGTNREQGCGLGLIICKEMIERNGDQIWVDSEPGQGTTVRFTIPLPKR